MEIIQFAIKFIVICFITLAFYEVAKFPNLFAEFDQLKVYNFEPNRDILFIFFHFAGLRFYNFFNLVDLIMGILKLVYDEFFIAIIPSYGHIIFELEFEVAMLVNFFLIQFRHFFLLGYAKEWEGVLNLLLRI